MWILSVFLIKCEKKIPNKNPQDNICIDLSWPFFLLFCSTYIHAMGKSHATMCNECVCWWMYAVCTRHTHTRIVMRTCGCCIVKSILHKLPWDFLFNLIYFYYGSVPYVYPLRLPTLWNKQNKKKIHKRRRRKDERDHGTWDWKTHTHTQLVHTVSSTVQSTYVLFTWRKS